MRRGDLLSSNSTPQQPVVIGGDPRPNGRPRPDEAPEPAAAPPSATNGPPQPRLHVQHSEESSTSAADRLQALCDGGSLQPIRSTVRSARMGDGARAGDGVFAAFGRIAGRPVGCYAQDATFAGGSVGEQHADTIVRLQRLARRARVPVIGFIASGGARMQEGLAALNGYARIFSEHVALSGDVPQITVITGTSAGGGCYSPALTDLIVMTRDARMFLTGPGVVREVTGEDVDPENLGGPRVHERNGVCQFVVDTDVDAALLVRHVLGYLPQHASAPLPLATPEPPADADPAVHVPPDFRKGYDMLTVAGAIVDGGSLLEVAPRWAANLVTAFARIEGRPVGVVANQPRRQAGVLDADAGQKGARFVRLCNAFGLPLVVLVDTPGFMPGTQQEASGVIRHGAKLLHAFAEATVPRITVVLRKAFGGAYITMNSKDLGADLALAWPDAELGIMGAAQAVGIVHRRELALADDPRHEREQLAIEYAARHLSAQSAAREGFIDEVVLPAHTRERIADALTTLDLRADTRDRVRNIPL